MKTTRYPLQTVFNQREREKDAAKKAFAQAIKDLESECQRLADLEAEREKLKMKREEMIPRMYDPDRDGLIKIPLVERRRDEIKFMSERIEEKGREVETQRETVRQAEANVDARKAQLVEADKGLKAIEKHREKWIEEVKKEAAMKEQKLGEEISLARFVRDRAEAAEEEEEAK